MTLDAVLTCTLCAAPNTVVIRKGVRDNPDEPVRVCNSCGFLFLEPPAYDLRTFYREEYRKSYSNAPGKVLTPQQHFDMMKPLIDQTVSAFTEAVPKGAKVLEIGCSSGFFLDAIRKDYEVSGNEWNPEDAAFVRDTLGIPCSEEPLETAYPGQSFTAIVALQVLEHIPKPIEWLTLLKSRLIGGGWVYLEVPNSDEALSSVYRLPEFQERWFRKSHLGYYNMHNFAAALGTVGFEAQIRQRQRYGLGNHLWWQFLRQPMPDALRAQAVYQPVPKEHPASFVLNRWFARIDREYRGMLDALKACDTLVAVGRKREI